MTQATNTKSTEVCFFVSKRTLRPNPRKMSFFRAQMKNPGDLDLCCFAFELWPMCLFSDAPVICCPFSNLKQSASNFRFHASKNSYLFLIWLFPFLFIPCTYDMLTIFILENVRLAIYHDWLRISPTFKLIPERKISW